MSRGRDEEGRRKPANRAGPRPVGAGSGTGGGAGPRGAKPLSDLLGELFVSRGLARVKATGELDAAWTLAIGEAGRGQTRVEGIRRGVLNVTVAHPTLLAELASFQKPQLLASLRQSLAGTPIHDIRFRVGPVGPGPPA